MSSTACRWNDINLFATFLRALGVLLVFSVVAGTLETVLSIRSVLPSHKPNRHQWTRTISSISTTLWRWGRNAIGVKE